MLPITQVACSISSQDCLSWSTDYELAIAAAEEVYILLPCQGGSEAWTHVRFPVNTFTYDEWPVRSQLTMADMSIGEEQSKVTIASLQWSPPGFAKYRRSILAILTTNLILSLWAPGSDPRDPEGWERVLIINNAAVPPSMAPSQRDCLLERVRSMAWLPVNDHPNPEFPSPKRVWGVPILAVADDNNGLWIFSLGSSFISGSSPWETQVLAYKTLVPLYQRSSRPSLLNEALNTRNYIDSIRTLQWDSASELLITCLSSSNSHQIRLKVLFAPWMCVTVTEIQVSKANAGRCYGWLRQAPESAQISMNKLKARYSSESNLNIDDVVLKIWGVACSEDLSAICVTCHPAKMVEYQPPAEDSATVVFGHRADEDAANRPAAFPWQAPPSVNHRQTRQAIVSTILAFLRKSTAIEETFKLTPFDLKFIYTAMTSQMLLDLGTKHQVSSFDDMELVLDILEGELGTKMQLERSLVTSCKLAAERQEQILDECVRERSCNGILAAGLQLLDHCPFCGDNYVGLISDARNPIETYCPKKHPFGWSLVSIALIIG